MEKSEKNFNYSTQVEIQTLASGKDASMKKTDNLIPDILNGPIVLTVVKLGIPILITQALVFLYMIIDTFFISLIDKHSTALLSGVGLVYAIYLIIYNISCCLFLATSSVTARGIGQKNEDVIKRTGDSGLLIALIICVVTYAIGSIFGKDIIKFLAGSKLTTEAIQYGVDYFSFLLPGMVMLLFMTTVSGILQGEGKTKQIGLAATVSTITNIILNPVLIFGFNLGVKGSALATSISIALTVIYYLSFFIRKKTTMQIQWKIFEPNIKIIKEILRIGIPASIGLILLNIAAMILNNVVGSISEASMNAWVLVSRTDQIFLIPAYAIGLTTITMVGQNYGHGNLERTEKIFHVSLLLCIICGLFLAPLYMIFAPVIFQQFSSDPDVIAGCVKQVRMLTFTTIGVSSLMVMQLAFQATGRPMPALINDIIRVVITSFPILLPFLHFPIKDMDPIFIFFGGGNLIAFIISIIWAWNHFKKLQFKGKLI